MLPAEAAQRLQQAVRRNPPVSLNVLVDEALRAGPWSVTSHRPEVPGVGPNDYFSEGLYWWPDPQNPEGPFIRKDCHRNPNRFAANAKDLKALSEALLVLGYGAYMLGRPECAKHACDLITVWFVEPGTRMNPNLEFGQAVRGISSGRARGIIETVELIFAAQGILLLEASGNLDARLAHSVRQWFAEYLQWLTTSEKGRHEKNATNNHATWWTAQVSAFALFTGDAGAQRLAWDHYREYLVPGQLREDGSCPSEEARPAALGYSAMNLDGFAAICRLAQTAGIDLWNFKTELDIGVERGFRYLVPYILQPSTWRKQQIEPYRSDRVLFPGLAGIAYNSAELLSAYDQLPRSQAPWIQFMDLVIRSEWPPPRA